jgi:hypothetical protein
VAVPATDALAVITPVEPAMVATTLLLLLHTPPDGESESVDTLLLHKDGLPNIADAVPTFTITVLLQPDGMV